MSDTKEVATKQEAVTLTGMLSDLKIRKRFEDILGARAAAFTSSIMSLYNADPALQQSDPGSILQSAVIAATMDLPINKNLGFAFIIPYKKDGKYFAQFQMGYKGFIQLAIRTGKYKTIHTTEVYRDEILRWDPLTGVFEPTPFDTWKLRDKGDFREVVGYMSYFKLLNGFEKTYYMTVEQLQVHGKKYSKSFDNPYGLWKINPHVQYLKTPLKLLLSKYGLLSIEMQKAMEVDQAVIDTTGEISYDDRPEDVPAASKPTGADKKINDDQFRLLCARVDKSGIDMEEVKLYVRTEFKKEHRHDLTMEELTKVLKWLEQDPEVKP